MTASSGDSSLSAKSPFIAFASDGKDIDTLKAFAAHHQWSESDIHQGDIKTATEFLKAHPSPVLLLVELPSAAEAPALLDALADVCDPQTKVITIGTVNEYSFYCWLMEIGIFSYLLKPLTEQSLEGAYAKSMETVSTAKSSKPLGKVIGVVGARGGVGATTLAVNLAGIIADLTKKQIALADIDPHEGSIALALDIEPSRGLRDAFEKPDRIDSLFIERVMHKPLGNLSVLSAEEALNERVNIHDNAIETLLKELKEKYDVVILDIPRHHGLVAKQAFQQADAVLLVTELTLISLRDTLRIGEVIREAIKSKPPIIVANRTGFASKQEVPLADFEKGINAKVVQQIPFAPDLFMQVSTEIPAIKQKNHAALKPLFALAAELIPEAKSKDDGKAAKSKGLFSKKKES